MLITFAGTKFNVYCSPYSTPAIL